MKQLPARKCLTCGIVFIPNTKKMVYHERKCFKKASYILTQERKKTLPKFPKYKCPKCSFFMTLDFDPIKKNSKWLAFNCPQCSTLMICVSDSIITEDMKL